MDADASMMSVLPRPAAIARDSAAHSTSRGCGSTNTVGCPKFGLNRLSRGEAFFGRVVERIEHIERFHSVGSLVLIEAKPEDCRVGWRHAVRKRHPIASGSKLVIGGSSERAQIESQATVKETVALPRIHSVF